MREPPTGRSSSAWRGSTGDEILIAATREARAILTRVEEVNFLSGPGRGVILIKLTSEGDRVLGFIASTGDRDLMTVETTPRRRTDHQHDQVRGDGPRRQGSGAAAARSVHQGRVAAARGAAATVGIAHRSRACDGRVRACTVYYRHHRSRHLAAEPVGEWSRFRGPNGSGVAETGTLPAEFGPTQNVIWKTDLPEGYSSPIVFGNRIYPDRLPRGPAAQLRAGSNDRQSAVGARGPTQSPGEARQAQPSRAPSAATDGERVYFFFARLRPGRLRRKRQGAVAPAARSVQ